MRLFCIGGAMKLTTVENCFCRPPITPATRLYCVLGDPVSHSLSPIIHNQAFAHHGIDAVYLAFSPASAQGAAQAIREFGILGASLTLPFKESIMAELDWIDKDAQKIGAVNTIINDGGRLLGYNTDANAAVDPLIPHGIRGKKVLIVGAGGAARAVAHGIHTHGGDLFISNRSRDRGKALARDFKAEFLSPDLLEEFKPDLIINTTSLGMESNPGLSCPLSCIQGAKVVLDVVYTPLETPLIKAARKQGITAIDGLSMFLAQGAAQFKLWTGKAPDLGKMRQTILKFKENKDD